MTLFFNKRWFWNNQGNDDYVTIRSILKLAFTLWIFDSFCHQYLQLRYSITPINHIINDVIDKIIYPNHNPCGLEGGEVDVVKDRFENFKCLAIAVLNESENLRGYIFLAFA